MSNSSWPERLHALGAFLFGGLGMAMVWIAVTVDGSVWFTVVAAVAAAFYFGYGLLLVRCPRQEGR